MNTKLNELNTEHKTDEIPRYLRTQINYVNHSKYIQNSPLDDDHYYDIFPDRIDCRCGPLISKLRHPTLA